MSNLQAEVVEHIPFGLERAGEDMVLFIVFLHDPKESLVVIYLRSEGFHFVALHWRCGQRI